MNNALLFSRLGHNVSVFSPVSFGKDLQSLTTCIPVQSVLYTGSTLFLIAALWFVGFGLFLLVVGMYVCCCRRRRYGYSRFAYALSIILLSLFTIASM